MASITRPRRVAAKIKLAQGRLHQFAVINSEFICEDCLLPSEKKRLGSDEVDVWDEYSDGWNGPVMCNRCKLSLPVYVTEKKGIPAGVVAIIARLEQEFTNLAGERDDTSRRKQAEIMALINELRHGQDPMEIAWQLTKVLVSNRGSALLSDISFNVLTPHRFKGR